MAVSTLRFPGWFPAEPPSERTLALCPSIPAKSADVGSLVLSKAPESPSCVVALSIHAVCGCVLSISHCFSGRNSPSSRLLETKDLYLTKKCVVHQDMIHPLNLGLALVSPGPIGVVSHQSSSTPLSARDMR